MGQIQTDSPGTDWPPLEGAFVLGDVDSPVAVCTLATQSLLQRLAGHPEIAIAGRVYTENIGIEKMVQNLLAGPRLSVLLLCGRESRHRVGQAILSLHMNGVDPVTRRIRGATGPEPVLPNLNLQDIVSFQQRFTLLNLIGEQDSERILAAARECQRAARATPNPAATPHPAGPVVVRSDRDPPSAWQYDPLGFFVIQLNRQRGLIRLEHYDQDRHHIHTLEGTTAAELSQTAVRMGLISLVGHAAYIGRELAYAEVALRFGLDYLQDSPLRKPAATS